MSGAEIETIELPHLQQYRLFTALFRDVQNVDFLRKQLLDGNTEYEYAMLDASMIVSRDHLLAACFRAVNDLRMQRLKSRNVHSEIVFAFSPNNNISESFRRFGLSDKTKNVIIVKVATTTGADLLTPSKDQVVAHLTGSVQGDLAAVDDTVLAQLRNDAALRKVYKMGPEPHMSLKDANPSRAAMSYILGSMAIRGT